MRELLIRLERYKNHPGITVSKGGWVANVWWPWRTRRFWLAMMTDPVFEADRR